MNTEILYKAKRADNSAWVEGFYSNLFEESINKEESVISFQHFEGADISYPYQTVNTIHAVVDEKTLSIFTGKIISDKKVFTNDIIKCLFSKTEQNGRLSFGGNLPEYMHGVVTFNQTQLCYQLEFKQPNPHNVISCTFGWGVEQFEHAGNIFDNEELLSVF